MRRFVMKKLVRDTVVDNILSRGGNKVEARTLGDEEFVRMLKAKLVEETRELEKASPEEVVSELADIEEIISHLLGVLHISREGVAKAGADHVKVAGAFDKRTFVETVELKDGDEWISYYEKRFPEIK